VLLAVDTGATLLGVAAIISAMSGIVSTIWALRKSHDEEHERCLERLKEVRAEAEQSAAELHERKMRDAN
jgi:C4-dicarboxylate-specific signal transduction histidine kinase